MQRSPLNTFAASTDETLTLLDGREIPIIYVTFVPSTYHFYYGQSGSMLLDVTNLMTRDQKRQFAGFDDATDNIRLSNINRTGQDAITKPLETSTSKLFVQNVSDDLAKKTDLGVKTLATTLGIVIGGYLIFQLLKKR